MRLACASTCTSEAVSCCCSHSTSQVLRAHLPKRVALLSVLRNSHKMDSLAVAGGCCCPVSCPPAPAPAPRNLFDFLGNWDLAPP